MRPSLLHPLGGRRQSRRRRTRAPRARGRAAYARAGHTPEGATAASPARMPADPVVARVRAAGGPSDCASYTCSCGYLFVASVSTSVICPHCGAGQAW